jgi:hypothetical protein
MSVISRPAFLSYRRRSSSLRPSIGIATVFANALPTTHHIVVLWALGANEPAIDAANADYQRPKFEI